MNQTLKQGPARMWLPATFRFKYINEVRKAVKEYDANLDFGFNEVTQQWCIYIRHGQAASATEGDFPILGFRGVPSADEAVKRLYNTDAVRRGVKILDESERLNTEWRKKQEAKHADVDGQVAEVLEWATRKLDDPINPTRKVFFNR